MAVYGTDVHSRFKTYIDDLRDPLFKAERSFLKENADRTAPEHIRYGYPRSVRVDAYEYRNDGTLCIYDLKTGRAGLSGLRADALAIAAARGFTYIRRVLVMEIRPRS